MNFIYSYHNKLIKKVTLLNNKFRRLLMILLDTILVYIAIVSANSLIFDLNFFNSLKNDFYKYDSVIFISLLIFFFTGQYKGITKYVGSYSLYFLSLRCLINSIAIYIFYSITKEEIYSSKSILIFCMFLILLTGIFRFIIRDFILQTKLINIGNQKQAAIYGSGDDSAAILNYLSRSKNYKITSFIESNPSYWGRNLSGIKVRPLSFLNKKNCKIRTLIIPSNETNKNTLKNIFKNFNSCNIEILKFPSLEKFSALDNYEDDIKPIDIQDLLKREIVKPDNKLLLKSIRKKSICVTGGGGSIGKEICQNILNFDPSFLIIIENNELSLYNLRNNLSSLNTNVEIKYILGDCSDKNFIDNLFSKFQVDIIYHCAAYKHVPIVEINPLTGLRNNIISTFNICSAAKFNNIKQVILISSDKAVRPTNIMGASKRVCEVILETFEKDKGINENKLITKFSMVRFGNVLDSSGSVVPLFKKQISSGGPITITDPNITRYFMTIEEASQLVIQAASQSKGGDIFLLDMGEPVKIIDLATQMVALSGLTIKNDKNPQGDINFHFTGLRFGEKLYEELLINAEAKPTEHKLIFRAREKYPFQKTELFWKEYNFLIKNIKESNLKETLESLSRIVPEWEKSNLHKYN